MSRVGIEFDGRSVGVVNASRESVKAIEQVKKTAAESARDNIVKRVQEKNSLQALAAEYTKVAQNAKKGSEVQVAALKLEQKALRELSDTHAVHSKRLQQSERDLGRFTRGGLAASGIMGHLGRSVAFASGTFLGGVGLIAVLKQSTTEAGALEVQLQRTDKTFGANAETIKSWSESSAKSLGMVRAQALDTVNTVGTLLKNMGVAASQVAVLAPRLVQRATDTASVKGIDPSVVNQAFVAALAGRTRGLKQLGIVIDQTTIAQEAERLGLAKSTVDLGKVTDATEKVRIAEYNLGKQIEKHGAQSVEAAKATIQLHNAQRLAEKAAAGHAEKLTDEQKALATYSAIMRQTANDQGNWAKHSGNLAEQERILHAEIGNVEETLGRGLIPQLEHYLPMLTNWLDRNERNGNFQREFNKAISLGTDAVHGIVAVVKVATAVFKTFADAVGGSTNAVELLAGVLVGSKLTKGVLGLTANLRALRLALIALGDGAVLAALGPLLPVIEVLASSGAAPNVPGLPTKGKAAIVADLARTGQITEAQLTAAAKAAGIDPSTPAGKALKNKKVVNYLYNWASQQGLVPGNTGGQQGRHRSATSSPRPRRPRSATRTSTAARRRCRSRPTAPA